MIPTGSDPELLLGPDAELHGSTTSDGPVEGLEVWTADVTVADGVSPAD